MKASRLLKPATAAALANAFGIAKLTAQLFVQSDVSGLAAVTRIGDV
jgi:hypothetical protein